MSSLVYFWAKSFKLSMKFYVLEFFHVWSCHKIGQGQSKVIIWIILFVLWYPMLHAKFHGHWSTGSGEEVLKVFTIWAWRQYWSCDLDSLNIFLFWRLHMKYGYNRLFGFWGNVWICKIMVVPRSKVKQWPWPFLPQIFIYLLRQPYLPFYAQSF